MKALNYIVVLIFTLSGTIAYAQTCIDELPEGTYQGETTQGSGGIYGSDDVSVTKVDSTYVISDVSAGFIDQIQVLNEDYSIAIEVGCDGTISPVTKTGIIGPIKILSGSWDPVSGTITYQWTVEASGISETTVLTYITE